MDRKRKRGDNTPVQKKRVKVTVPDGDSTPTPGPFPPPTPGTGTKHTTHESTEKPRRQIRKLAPVRPFPTVPLSVSATGPRSAHKEGKNLICISRKTPLGSYMRRCKDVILKDNYKTLHLSAMGAAIPHLALLAASLPSILPFAADEIQLEITTGTTNVQDEILPDDEDEEASVETRGKSTMLVVLKIGDGDEPGGPAPPPQRKKKKAKAGSSKGTGGKHSAKGTANPTGDVEEIVVQEPEQMDMS